jgi:GNAT superfamily N-acetyltransferase
MTIVSSTGKETPAIIELLKNSLGESLMPKSEKFWNWKHIENPFGRSPVLLAYEGGQLAGVRAFMKWEWKNKDRVFRAVRAVDTATHPAHQGKGIFKILTQQLAQQCKDEGVDFIFNTPNQSSKPGYLKMGWRSAGKLSLGFVPLLNFSSAKTSFEDTYKWNADLITQLSDKTNSIQLTTNYSRAYLDWRYGRNPNIRYYCLGDETNGGSYFLVFRLKPHRFGPELRVCDYFFSDAKALKRMKKHLAKASKEAGARFISYCATANGKLFIFPQLAIGPEVTVRPLNELGFPLDFGPWYPSLGDLEVF